MLRLIISIISISIAISISAQTTKGKENVRVYFTDDSSTLISVYNSLDLSYIPKKYTKIVTNDTKAYEIISNYSQKLSFSKTLLIPSDPNYSIEMKKKITLIEDRTTTTQMSYGSSGVNSRSYSNFSYRFTVGDSKPIDAGYSGENISLYLQSDPEASKILAEFTSKRKKLIYGTIGFLGAIVIATINGFTEDESQTSFNPQSGKLEETKKVKTSSAVIAGVGFVAGCYGWYNYSNSPEYIFKAVDLYNNNLDKLP